MITRLRKRAPITAVVRDQRVGLSWGRWIYATLLLGCGMAVLNYLVGASIFLRADGLVLQRRYTVAPPFEASVAAVLVQPGASVRKGAPLAQLESVSLSRTLAELAARQAELTTRVAQARSRLAMTKRMLPLALQHHDEMARSLAQVEQLRGRNLANARRMEEALTASFAARERLVGLQAQDAGLTTELELLERAHQEADAAIQELRRIYGDGLITAPADGIVGASVAAQGDVIVSGSPVLVIHSGEPFVLAYLPDSYLFSVREGQRVNVSNGPRQSLATVEAVLPVADTLPAEFQNTFRPRDRSQLVRLRLPAEHSFATLQKVRVSQCLTPDCRPIADVAADMANDVAGHLQRLAARFESFAREHMRWSTASATGPASSQ